MDNYDLQEFRRLLIEDPSAADGILKKELGDQQFIQLEKSRKKFAERSRVEFKFYMQHQLGS
jgi:hypothetical protein